MCCMTTTHDAPLHDLTPDAVRNALRAAGLPARPFQHHDQIGSTNDAALAWLRADVPPPAGAFVIAHHQAGGRGRLGRSWVTTPGAALTVTLIAYPPVGHLARLPLAGAVMVTEALARFGITAGIKWPNDVLVAERKVCGVLPETAMHGDRLIGAVLGIGINVREDFTGTPLAATAGGLAPLTGLSIDRAALLAALIARADHWLPRLGDPVLFAVWRSHLVTVGQRVRVAHVTDAVDPTYWTGLALDVAENGALIVQTDEGAVRQVLAGDIMPVDASTAAEEG